MDLQGCVSTSVEMEKVELISKYKLRNGMWESLVIILGVILVYIVVEKKPFTRFLKKESEKESEEEVEKLLKETEKEIEQEGRL